MRWTQLRLIALNYNKFRASLTKRMNNQVKILSIINIKGLGELAEILHSFYGIAPGTKIFDINSEKEWILIKRVYNGTLLSENKETFFKCETEFEHLSQAHRNEEEKERYINEELTKRSNNVYWYLIRTFNKNN